MRTVLLASLRVHARRYLAAVLAVVIGVSFIVVTNALASSARAGLAGQLELPYRGADVVLVDLDGKQAADVMTRAAAQQDSASVIGYTLQPAAGRGLPVEEVSVAAMSSDPRLRWQTLVDGRFPDRPGEGVADANAIKSTSLRLGDKLTVGAGDQAVVVTLVGLVDTPSALPGASLYLPWQDVSVWADGLEVESVAYAGDPSAAGIAAGTVVSVPEHVQHRLVEYNQGVDVLAYLLLLFAAVALAVAVLVIANTFSILFAQRRHDLALLRCVGASGRQLMRAMRVEALTIGVLASTTGVIIGAAIGHGLLPLIRALAPTVPLGAVSLSPVWLTGAFGVGVLVTLAASWLPTRAVSAVTPLTALRPQTGADGRAACGRVQLALGLGLLGSGVVLLGLAIVLNNLVVMIIGGAAAFTGVLLLGPVIVPAAIRLTGRMAAPVLGASSRLAVGNAVRHPRRTATTTASLLIGITLTTAVLTGLAGSRQAVEGEMARQHPIDFSITGGTVDPAMLSKVRQVPGVVAAVGIPGTQAEASDGVGELTLLTVSADTSTVTHAPLDRPSVGEILLPYERAPEGVETVQVEAAGRTVSLRVRTGEGWGPSAALIAPETLSELATQGEVSAIWIRADSDTDPENLMGDLTAIGVPAGADVGGGLGERAYVELQLNVLTWAMVGLLGIAVLIALIGIGNTLGLSVIERGREHALLRALGLTRRQLRMMLGTEALLLSVVATLMGTAIGVSFAWVGMMTVVRPVIAEVSMAIPWAQLGLMLAVSAVAGLLACMVPARRAARVPPASGLAWD